MWKKVFDFGGVDHACCEGYVFQPSTALSSFKQKRAASLPAPQEEQAVE